MENRENLNSSLNNSVKEDDTSTTGDIWTDGTSTIGDTLIFSDASLSEDSFCRVSVCGLDGQKSKSIEVTELSKVALLVKKPS